MRLLKYDKDEELTIVSLDDKELPPYAILSHTWEGDAEEVTFAHIENDDGKTKCATSYNDTAPRNKHVMIKRWREITLFGYHSFVPASFAPRQLEIASIIPRVGNNALNFIVTVRRGRTLYEGCRVSGGYSALATPIAHLIPPIAHLIPPTAHLIPPIAHLIPPIAHLIPPIAHLTPARQALQRSARIWIAISHSCASSLLCHYALPINDGSLCSVSIWVKPYVLSARSSKAGSDTQPNSQDVYWRRVIERLMRTILQD
ncbi:hypothetical protein EK21DRAFT_94643 [Setomelanomma holmii]|uniref:Uncharacterized protein n=1 Tax=Setomelanomma holmii TaxID=210430 RepID=A0A9P4GW37_9PLEO|nr:hypothetical protein EK21DRAFT_94643 [Setomelanomma holmii]